MSLQTQVVLRGHRTVPELCALLRAAGALDVQARARQLPGMWELRATLPSAGEQGCREGRERWQEPPGELVIDTFPDGLVDGDFPELGAGPLTLLSMAYQPSAVELGRATSVKEV